MSDGTPDETRAEETSLAIPDTAVAAWVADLAQDTLDWAAYAQQKLLEGDQAEASRALATINSQIEEIQKHAEVTQVVVGGLVEMVKAVTSQRDELVREVETLKDEAEWIEESAFAGGAEVGEQYMMDQIYDDPSMVTDMVDEARAHDLQYLIGQLRRVGNDSAAQLLEARAEQARQNKEELERIESDAREWYYALPIQARIDAIPDDEGRDEDETVGEEFDRAESEDPGDDPENES